MLKRRVALVSFCGVAGFIAFALPPVTVLGQNLVTNGSFELPTDTTSSESFLMTGWNKVGSSIRRSVFQAPPDGRWDLWLRTFEPSGEVNQTIAGISAGTSYTFNVSTRFEANFNQTTGTVYGTLDFLNASNTSVGTTGFQVAFSDAYDPANWTIKTFNPTAPAGATQAVVKLGWLNGGGSGPSLSVFFDKIELLGTGSTTQWNWITNGSGDWNVTDNWGGDGTIPNGVGSLAVFGSAISSNQTVFTNTAVTVGTLNFANTNTYVLTGAGSLTLQATGSNSAFVNVTNGTQKVNLPTVVASNTTLNVSSGATLKVSDPVTVNAGKTITQTGSGAVQYESTVDVLTGGGIQLGSSSHMNRLTLGDGSTATLLLGGGSATAQKIDTVGLNATSVLDVNDNDLVTGTGKSTIENLVKNARNGGAWNQPGITSTTAKNNANHTTGLGVISGAEYNTVGGTGTFSNRSYSSTDTLVKYTWNGDANLDGRVTFDDYVKIDTGFNTGRTGWLNGDFNYSGAVNFDDYVLIDIAFNQQNGTLGRAVNWISGDDRSAAGLDSPGMSEVLQHLDQFGGAYGSAFLAAVPEPTSLAMLGIGATALVTRKRRRSA